MTQKNKQIGVITSAGLRIGQVPERRATVAFAPGAVAVFGPRVSRVGIALADPGNTVRVIESGHEGVSVDIEGSADVERLSKLVESAATRVAEVAAIPLRCHIEVHLGVRMDMGLGSRDAVVAATALAVNAFLGKPLRKTELGGVCVPLHTGTAGQLAASLLGGIVLVRSLDPWDVVRVPVPAGLAVAVLPGRPAPPVTNEWSEPHAADLAAFVGACHSGDIALLSRALRREVTHAGIAATARSAAMDLGALGGFASSETLCHVLCRSLHSAAEVADAMADAAERLGGAHSVIISSADCPGAKLI